MARRRLIVLLGGLALARAVCAAGLAWGELSDHQREVLAPLEADWHDMSEARRQKWVGIAGRYDGLSAQEQVRMRDRMVRWVRLAPEERARARAGYLALRSAPPERRKRLSEEWRRHHAQAAKQGEAEAGADAIGPAPAMPDGNGEQ